MHEDAYLSLLHESPLHGIRNSHNWAHGVDKLLIPSIDDILSKHPSGNHSKAKSKVMFLLNDLNITDEESWIQPTSYGT